jgi:hypothetical protein
MKLLALIITVILMSVFSESIYAQNDRVELPNMDVTADIDTEKQALEDELRRRILQEKNGAKKIKLMEKLREITESYIPKRITIELQKKADRKKMQAFDQYIQCINTKDMDECSDLKEELDSLTTKSSTPAVLEANTLNRNALSRLHECSQVTQDFFPGFRAVVEINFSIDEQGQATSAYINEDESEISHDLIMFSKCVEHFAQKLNFKNDSGKSASFKKNFIFG